MKKLALLMIVLFTFSNCVEEGEAGEQGLEIAALQIEDDESADNMRDLRIRTRGLTFWVHKKIQMPTDVEDTWMFAGRISRNIQSISATTQDLDVKIEQISKRKFRFFLSFENFQSALIYGVHVQVKTTAGMHTLNISLEGRLDKGVGSSYIYPNRRIRLMAVNGDPMFRATVTTRKSFRWLEGWNDDDSEPISTKVSSKKFYLDFPSWAITSAASPYDDALVLVGEGQRGREYQRKAHIGVAIVKMKLTNGDPSQVWPAPSCVPNGKVLEQLACTIN